MVHFQNSTVVDGVRPCPLMTPILKVVVQAPAALLLIQLSANVPGKAVNGDPIVFCQATHGDTWRKFLALAVLSIWEMN